MSTYAHTPTLKHASASQQAHLCFKLKSMQLKSLNTLRDSKIYKNEEEKTKKKREKEKDTKQNALIKFKMCNS